MGIEDYEVERQEQIGRLVRNYKYYQDKLLQVTQRNRSVLLKKIYNKHNFDLARLEEFKEGVVERIAAKAIKNIAATLNDRKDPGERQNILLDSISDDDADSARSRLRTLSRNLMQLEEETGQQVGYLGFPFLQGHPSPDFYIRGPVVLFPISVEYRRQAKNGGWFLHLADKRPVLNGALIAALRKKGGYQILDDYEESFDEMIEDISASEVQTGEYFFGRISNWIQTIIPIDESQNNSQIEPITPLGRDDIERLEEQPFHLVNHMIAGNFPQADNEIYRDYGALIQNAEMLDVGMIGDLINVGIQDLEPAPRGDDGDDGDARIDIDQAGNGKLNSILESDSSQDEVILESKNSDLVVVRGPPGTGKSQVIVNLISDALTNNKKILVVCQKRAALEVVKQRLAKVDLDRYVVFLEKEIDDKIKMYKQLHDIIEADPPRASRAELTIEAISGKIDACVGHLSSLGTALRKEHFGGATAHRIYSRADGGYRPVLDLSSAGLTLDWVDLEDYLGKIRYVEAAFKRYEDAGHPWLGRRGFADFGLMEKNKLEHLLGGIAHMPRDCILAGSREDQHKLDALIGPYVDAVTSIKRDDKRLSEQIQNILGRDADDDFVRDNIDAVRRGVKFWQAFPKLLGVFDAKTRQLLLSMTGDAESILSHVSKMSSTLDEFDDVWFGRRELSRLSAGKKKAMRGQLGELVDLAPQCLLTVSPVRQDLLYELFNSYVNNSGFMGSKRKRLSRQIEAILGRQVDDRFVQSNLEAARRGVDFWKILSKMLGVLDPETREHFTSMTAADAGSMGPHLAEMLTHLEEDNMAWFCRKNLDTLDRGKMADWLGELVALAPRCLLTDSSGKQDLLYGLFNSYVNDAGFLGSKRKKTGKQIGEMLGRQVDDVFVQSNLDAVRRGVEFWQTFPRLLDVLDSERRAELVTTAVRDPRMLEMRLDGMRRTLAEFESAWSGMVDPSGLGADERTNLKTWLASVADLAPQCLLTDNSDDQSRLLELFEDHLNCLQPLKAKSNRMAKQMDKILERRLDDWLARDSTDAAVTGVADGATPPPYGVVKPTSTTTRPPKPRLGLRDLVADGAETDGRLGHIRDAVGFGVKFWDGFSDLLDAFTPERQSVLASMTADTASLASHLGEMRQTLGEFDAMQEFDRNKNDYDESIIKILHMIGPHAGADDDWVEMIRQEIYVYWLACIEQEHPILKGDPISKYHAERDKLVKLFERKQKIIQKTIQRNIKGVVRLKGMYGRNRPAGSDEWRAFAGELKKRRRVKPVRKMFQKFGPYMFQIAPCWLASPESVSKIFPLERNLFDMVIVDEASQLAVERAIPFLYRAKRAVIAGDEKQLPPFDLFQIRDDASDEGWGDDDEEISDEKSLLDLARIRYKTINLSWHYRSQYQDLINFSNHAFYEGLLNVAPNAANDPMHPPIRWVRCDGMWENQSNHVEAKRVVDEMSAVWKRGLEQGACPSIGVITFNEKQQELVKDVVDTRLESDPEFLELHTAAHETGRKDDSLFVKNIENVQGDERDVIIFSIGYARNEDGILANRFGSLSNKGGENRLNVAVTRARKEMIVVSSIEPTDIKYTSKNDGPRRFRQFLEYAKMTNALNEDGQRAVLAEINPDMGVNGDSDVAEFDSEFEVQVYEKLRERGHNVVAQVGFSGYRIDLAIVHPNDENRYILGVECDGATFHSARSIKERDIMRQKFLEEKGWIIERIWSRNWWKDPGREIDRIDARIRDLAGQDAA